MPDTDNSFSIIKKTKRVLPRGLPSFKDIKNTVLGKTYTVSLVFVGDTYSQKLNKTYRKKTRPANVLSFPLAKNEGEVFLNPRQAARDAKKYRVGQADFLGYLFIHGLLHLKGLRHGSKMKEAEKRICKKYALSVPSHLL